MAVYMGFLYAYVLMCIQACMCVWEYGDFFMHMCAHVYICTHVCMSVWKPQDNVEGHSSDAIYRFLSTGSFAGLKLTWGLGALGRRV